MGVGAHFELSVRELTFIHEISDDRRPYSIFGQRFVTTLMPAASAFAAGAFSGVLNLTFAFRTRGQVGRECQIHSTSCHRIIRLGETVFLM
jgi:hypothetical protein